KRPVPVRTIALTAGSAWTSLRHFSRSTRSAWPRAFTGGLFMRRTATSPCFSHSTIATAASPLVQVSDPPGLTPLFPLPPSRPGVRPRGSDTCLGARRCVGLVSGQQASKSKAKAQVGEEQYHAARVDDGPAAAGLERDRLCGRGLPRCGDRVA